MSESKQSCNCRHETYSLIKYSDKTIVEVKHFNVSSKSIYGQEYIHHYYCEYTDIKPLLVDPSTVQKIDHSHIKSDKKTEKYRWREGIFETHALHRYKDKEIIKVVWSTGGPSYRTKDEGNPRYLGHQYCEFDDYWTEAVLRPKTKYINKDWTPSFKTTKYIGMEDLAWMPPEKVLSLLSIQIKRNR